MVNRENFVLTKYKKKVAHKISSSIMLPNGEQVCIMKVRNNIDGFKYRLITPLFNVYGIRWKQYKEKTVTTHEFIYQPKGLPHMKKGSTEYVEAFKELVKYERLALGKYYPRTYKATIYKTYSIIPELVIKEVNDILVLEGFKPIV